MSATIAATYGAVVGVLLGVLAMAVRHEREPAIARELAPAVVVVIVHRDVKPVNIDVSDDAIPYPPASEEDEPPQRPWQTLRAMGSTTQQQQETP